MRNNPSGTQGGDSGMKKPEKHGCSKTKEYLVWSGMIARCTNPKGTGFARYGGRGIAVCSTWRNSFSAFKRDVGPRPSPLHSIDRIDNDGNYEPGNVRWVTRAVQAANKSGTRLITLNGTTLPMMKMGSFLGVSKWSLRHHIDSGLSPTQALEATYKTKELKSVCGPTGKVNAKILTFEGVTLPLMALARHLGINKWTFRTAIDRGVSVEQAVARGRVLRDKASK